MLEIAKFFVPSLVERAAQNLRGAGGHSLRHFGAVLVDMRLGKHHICLEAEVADVNHNLLSVPKLEDGHYSVNFKEGARAITCGSDVFVPMARAACTT